MTENIARGPVYAGFALTAAEVRLAQRSRNPAEREEEENHPGEREEPVNCQDTLDRIAKATPTSLGNLVANLVDLPKSLVLLGPCFRGCVLAYPPG